MWITNIDVPLHSKIYYMKYKTIKAIGLALQANQITQEEAVKAYKLLQVNRETQKIVKQLNAAATTAGFKKPK